MNEWSPGGNYSRPGTPNQPGRSFRTQWDESEKGTKPLMVNIRGVTESRNRSFQQLSMEDVSKCLATTAGKPKKAGTGTSDPRFKRVISPGVQNDACVGTEVKRQKSMAVAQEKESLKEREGVWDPGEFKPSADQPETAEQPKADPEVKAGEPGEFSHSPGGDSQNFDQSQDHLKAVDKLSFSHDIVVKSFSKESLSDCTINTRNTSLASEDLVDEFPNDVSVCPSAMRVKKVQNWIQDNKSKPEKKQSVITVIGQTQGQDNLCSALREIDKRKKLVKELDKYAVCKKLTDADKDKEICDLVAKINFLSNVGRIMFSQKKQDHGNELQKSSCDKIDKTVDGIDNEKMGGPRGDAKPDPISQTALSSKRPSRKKSKKCQSECIVKGTFRELLARVPYQWLFCALVVLGGFLCWFTFHGSFLSLELFSQKPKPMTWYEKICMWIWEIFRPLKNYQRRAPWHA